MKVKLFKLYCYYDDENEYKIASQIENDFEWEEISENDFEILKNGIKHHNDKASYYNGDFQYLLVTEQIKVKPVLQDLIVKFAAEEEKRKIEEEKRRKKEEQRLKEAAKKKEEKEANKLKRLKEQIAKLEKEQNNV